MGTDRTIYLLRHAVSLSDRNTPESAWPLSAQGRAQAQGLISALSGLRVDVVFSSPYDRCVETVRPLAEARGLAVHIESDLRERRLAGSYMDDFLDALHQNWEDFEFTHPGGESSASAQGRGVQAVERSLRAHPGAYHVLLSSHGNLIALLMHAVNPKHGWETWRRLGNPALIELRGGDEAASWRIERIVWQLQTNP